MTHYVIMYYRTQDSISGVVLISATTTSRAILNGANVCRQQNKLSSSVHLNSKVLFEGDDPEEATEFFNKLIEKMNEYQASMN